MVRKKCKAVPRLARDPWIRLVLSRPAERLIFIHFHANGRGPGADLSTICHKLRKMYIYRHTRAQIRCSRINVSMLYRLSYSAATVTSPLLNSGYFWISKSSPGRLKDLFSGNRRGPENALKHQMSQGHKNVQSRTGALTRDPRITVTVLYWLSYPATTFTFSSAYLRFIPNL